MKDVYLGLTNLSTLKDSEWGRENSRFVEILFEMEDLDENDHAGWRKGMNELFSLTDDDEDPLERIRISKSDLFALKAYDEEQERLAACRQIIEEETVWKATI
ncbi:MAG: hypothetical protein FWG65_12505 [Turicibacter sp.]|nr:hypothetical protein [Turicibacter sp.]